MSLGPYPRGDADGMRDLARRLRWNAAILRNSPGMIADDFDRLPIRASFFSLMSLRMLRLRATGLAAGTALDGLAKLLESKADDVRQAQRSWVRTRDRLAEQAAENARQEQP